MGRQADGQSRRLLICRGLPGTGERQMSDHRAPPLRQASPLPLWRNTEQT